MKTKILILGNTGMLGSMVYNYFTDNSENEIVGTSRKEFDAEEFLITKNQYAFVKEFDFIINCIGIIKPLCRDNDPVGVYNAIKINALFPHELANFCRGTRAKIIQIATDCVFSGEKGSYKEDDPHDPLDVYGKTKSLGEVFEENFLNIRCSIIGPELKSKYGLLNWFLSQKNGSEVPGFVNHKWNGVTTLQFAKLCLKIIEKNKFNEVVKVNKMHHFVPNNSISKFELLKIFSKIFKKDLKVKPIESSEGDIDRTLSSKYKILSSTFGLSDIESALGELRDYVKL